MSKETFLSNIQQVERIASVSKLRRMLVSPVKYWNAIFFREFVYKKTKQEKEVLSNTFFDTKMHLLLPSSTDIYLTGGKSHISEIRLAKYLINHLNEKDTFLDIGAHYGYFSLLASKLVGPVGKVYSFEASPTTFRILDKNCKPLPNVNNYHRAVSDENSTLSFYEFPNLYSEYNSMDIEQFKNEDWFAEYQPKELKIKSVIMDEFLSEEQIHPSIIKIDVEGAEYKVISGLKKYLANNAPAVVLEYLSDDSVNEAHKKAEGLLHSLGYQANVIINDGTISAVQDICSNIKAEGLVSDNIVFVKA